MEKGKNQFRTIKADIRPVNLLKEPDIQQAGYPVLPDFFFVRQLIDNKINKKLLHYFTFV